MNNTFIYYRREMLAFSNIIFDFCMHMSNLNADIITCLMNFLDEEKREDEDRGTSHAA